MLKHGQNGTREVLVVEVECAHCGNNEVSQVPGVWTPMPMNEEGLVQGPVVPVVLLGCSRCGFLQMFSPQAVAPQPFPQPEAEV